MYKIVNLDLNNKYKLNIYLDNYLIKTINLNASNLWYTNFDEKFTDVKNKKLNIKVVDNDEKNVENVQIEFINFKSNKKIIDEKNIR